MKISKNKVHALMCERGIKTQKELAKMMGIKGNTLVQYFYVTNARPETLLRVAKALNCEPKELVDWD